MEKLKIFISWSGPRSQGVAEALRDWLPNVLQNVDAWLSTSDIEKGEKWRHVIEGKLQECDFGLICLTPDNLKSPWLLFEAGALAKKEKSRVFTYLLAMKDTDVIDPLSQFQHTFATEGDTKKLVGTINKALADASIEADRVARQFDKWWPDLHDRLKRILESPAPEVHERSPGEKIDEILTRVRALESVLVARVISDASENLEVLRVQVRQRMDLQKAQKETAMRLGALSERANVLSEAGERGVEYENIQRQIAEATVYIMTLEKQIESMGKYDQIMTGLLAATAKRNRAAHQPAVEQ